MTNPARPLDELLPCPFCDSTAIMVLLEFQVEPYCMCNDCGATGPMSKNNDLEPGKAAFRKHIEDDAIEAWNCRPVSAPAANLMFCGHHQSCVVSGDEGTAHCGYCAALASASASSADDELYNRLCQLLLDQIKESDPREWDGDDVLRRTIRERDEAQSQLAAARQVIEQCDEALKLYPSGIANAARQAVAKWKGEQR